MIKKCWKKVHTPLIMKMCVVDFLFTGRAVPTIFFWHTHLFIHFLKIRIWSTRGLFYVLSTHMTHLLSWWALSIGNQSIDSSFSGNKSEVESLPKACHFVKNLVHRLWQTAGVGCNLRLENQSSECSQQSFKSRWVTHVAKVFCVTRSALHCSLLLHLGGYDVVSRVSRA